jgi:protein-tyrosine phosphatase
VISIARNKEDLKKVDFVMNIVEPGKNRSVPDPYYGGHDGFMKIFKMLDLACEEIIEDIKRKNK